jgi:chitodextrinase
MGVTPRRSGGTGYCPQLGEGSLRVSGDNDSMLTRRRPSAATFVAIIATLLIGTQTGLAAGSQSGREGPARVASVEVTATGNSSVTIAWPHSRDDDVAGYSVYLDGARVGTLAPDRVKRWRDRDMLTYTLDRLACGKGFSVAVDAFDRGDRHSPVTTLTVSTAACPDTTPPSAPAAIRQVATTETSLMVTWSSSTDDVGVVEYGLYTGGLRVASSSDASATLTNLTCGTGYLVAIDAGDAAGNRSTQATSYLATAPCASRSTGGASTGAAAAPTSPAGAVANSSPTAGNAGATAAAASATGAVRQTIANGATLPSIVDWRAVYDRNGDGREDDPGKMEFRVDGRVVLTEDLIPFGDTFAVGSIKVANGSHTFEVRALDTTGTLLATNTVTATIGAPSAPPPSGTRTVQQTIANGATLPSIVAWRAVYDRNGDGREDDPGKMEFRVDGRVVLTEDLIPFGDTFAVGSIKVANGSHTFEVRALDTTGTLLATNTVTATIVAPTTPPPSADTTAPSQPGNLRITSATATSVTIAWNPSTDNVGVTRYDVHRSGTRVGSPTTTSYVLNGLTCGTAYPVGVRAVDAAGNASPQTTMSITTSACSDTQPPTAPGNVTASARTTTSISLTWAAASDNTGVAGYRLYNGATVAQTTAGTTGIVGGLACGTNYTLAVDAFDASGNSSPKATVMVSTLPCADTTPPTQPSNLRLTSATTTTATLAWNAATDNVGVTSYDVLRAGTKVGSASTTSYVMNGLTCGTTYSVGVRALDGAGNASSQATASITTSACSPPPQTGFPNASNTGVPAGTTLTPSGGMTITTAGAVVDGRDITGQVVVNAPNVTIRNSRIRSNSMWVIDNNSTGLLVEDSEIINRPVAGQPNCHNGIGNANFTVRRTEITGCENAMNIDSPGNVTFVDNYVHDLDTTGPSYVWGNDPHTDGIQIGRGAANMVFRHNYIDPIGAVVGAGGTSGIIIGSNIPDLNLRIEDNYIDGGNSSYAIYAPRIQVNSLYINRNKLGRGVYGYTACVKVGNTVTEFTDNRDAASDALLSPDNGAGGSCSN